MTGDEYAKRLESLSDRELMQAAGEWLSDSVSAHYEFGGDAPSETQGKRITGELYRRAGNGIPNRVMGNGEGFTTLVLTDAESRLIRQVLEVVSAPSTRPEAKALDAYNRGIQRATGRIKAEFDEEQKRRKAKQT